MSDPLSISASLAGILSIGFSVAKGLYRIAEGIGSARQEVRIYADEIDSFSKLLGRVKDEVESTGDISDELQDLVTDVLSLCERLLAPLDRLQKALSPLLVRFRPSPGKFGHFVLKVRWFFMFRDELLVCRDALRGHHRILDTILEVMILKSNRTRRPETIQLSDLASKFIPSHLF